MKEVTNGDTVGTGVINPPMPLTLGRIKVAGAEPGDGVIWVR